MIAPQHRGEQYQEGKDMPEDAKTQKPKPQPKKETRPTPVFTDYASI